jgi:hypothetical protein
MIIQDLNFLMKNNSDFLTNYLNKILKWFPKQLKKFKDIKIVYKILICSQWKNYQIVELDLWMYRILIFSDYKVSLKMNTNLKMIFIALELYYNFKSMIHKKENIWNKQKLFTMLSKENNKNQKENISVKVLMKLQKRKKNKWKLLANFLKQDNKFLNLIVVKMKYYKALIILMDLKQQKEMK